MSATIRRRKNRMRRKSSEREQNGVYAVLSKEASALEELAANFHMMNKELLTPGGVPRMRMGTRVMASLMVQKGERKDLVVSHAGLPESRAPDGHKSQSMDFSFTAKEREADRQGEEHKKSRRHDLDDLEQKSRGKLDRREYKNFKRDMDNDSVKRGMKDWDRKEEGNKRYDDDHEPRRREDYDRGEEKRSRRHDEDDMKPKSRDGYERKEERRSKKRESDSRLTYDREPSSHRRKGR